AVGAYESVETDTLDFEVLPGDHFLLCSDGLHAYLKDSDVPEIMTADDIADAPKTMVALANAGGGHDNITAGGVRVGPGGTRGPARRARQRSGEPRRRAQEDAAVQAPHVQGDHAAPERAGGQGLQGGREDHRGE